MDCNLRTFINQYYHFVLCSNSNILYLLAFFKHSNTLSVISSEKISADLSIDSTVIIPYGAGRKYAAVIKNIGSNARCEAKSEKLFSQPPTTSMPLVKGSPA
uniref:MSP domain-containing protein n=1 Tax=Heterorhabditis bacteriophora TaxID=37862 RepID=A0A1I7WLD5_HETBA